MRSIHPTLPGVLLLGLAFAAEAQTPSVQPVPQVQVTGTGLIAAPPDAVQFRVGANATRDTAREALDEVNQALATLQRVLGETGIDPRFVRTAQFQVAPQYAPRKRGDAPPTVAGYRVSHVLAVTTDDVPGLGLLMDQLVAGGANVFENVRFINLDPERWRDDARRAAVKDGARRAQLLAEAAGKRLGRLVLINDGGGPVVRPQSFGAERMLAASVPIAPGQNEYRVTVTMVYEFR